MTEQPEVVSGLRKRWSDLRADVLFLPRLEQMTVQTEEAGLEAVEFLRVVPVVEEVMVPVAPQVVTTDVWQLAGWSEAEADQLRMWPLVGRTFEGNKVTRTCPDCGGSRILTCSTCSGQGQVVCSLCHGSGQRACSACGGSGHRHVHRTVRNRNRSHRTVTERHTCMHCGGFGRERCMHCMGSGRLTCHTCGGSGEVTCRTCSINGTVDLYHRVSFAESGVKTHVLPFSLPEYAQPVRLTEGYVRLQPREEKQPYDVMDARSLLTDRGIAEPDSRLFFVRKAKATLHKVYDPQTRELAATFVDGEPEPIFALHRTSLDPKWSPERVRRKALAAAILYAVGPLLLAGFLMAHQPLIGVGALVAALIGALLLNNHPVQAFRLAFLDVQCKTHYQPASMRCPHCEKDLCHECLLPSVRCPACGKVVSEAVTHLVEEGHWVEADAPVKEQEG